jgi:tetratricopeptide (TPR) repeat protein
MHSRSGVVIATLGLWLSGAAGAQDTVNLKDASNKQGSIQDSDFRGIKLSISGGGSTSIKRDEIQSHTLDPKSLPKEFKAGEDEYNRGKYDEAVASFQAVLDNKKARSVIRQDAWMKQAQSYVRLEKAEEAVKALKGLLEEYPQTWHLEEADALVIAVLTRTGKAQDAVAFAEAEEARVAKLEGSGSLVERIKLLKARAYLAAGDPKKAKAEAGAAAGGTSPGAGAAKVLLGEIALTEKNAGEADKHFRDALKNVTARSDRAAVFNGLGTILLEKGKDAANAKKTDDIQEALLFFLRTAIVEIPEAGESTEAHEAGVYNTAVAFQYLGELGTPSAGSKSETKADGKTDDAQGRSLQRAREWFRRLLREYPQSKYAADAQTRLQKLGG